MKPSSSSRRSSIAFGALSLFALFAGLVACSSFTAPPDPEPVSAGAGSPSRPNVPATATVAHHDAPPTNYAATAGAEERIGASHILIAYKGALRAAPTITRTKEEARRRAEQVVQKARSGVSFEKLVKEYSDEPGAAARGGALGVFPRRAMVKPFADAAFALKPGQISDVVETNFGFHIIKRTQ